MIILRDKSFIGLDDGFGGKLGRIARSKFYKRMESYEKFGPWVVKMSSHAEDEYLDMTDEDQAKVDKILKELETKPFQGNYGQHPLWEFYDKDNVDEIWSAELNKKDRVNYLVSKLQNYINVTNLKGHYVLNIPYNVR